MSDRIEKSIFDRVKSLAEQAKKELEDEKDEDVELEGEETFEERLECLIGSFNKDWFDFDDLTPDEMTTINKVVQKHYEEQPHMRHKPMKEMTVSDLMNVYGYIVTSIIQKDLLINLMSFMVMGVYNKSYFDYHSK